MTAANAVAPTAISIVEPLRTLLAQRLQTESQKIDPRRSFVELGADSLVFVDIAHWLETNTGVQIEAHQLFEELTNLEQLSAYVTQHASCLPQTLSEASPARDLAPPQPSTARAGQEPRGQWSSGSSEGVESLEALIAQQLELMRTQLRLLGDPTSDRLASQPVEPAPKSARPKPRPSSPASESSPLHTAEQREYVDRFVARYGKRTAKSKARAAESRALLADRRAAVGVSLLVKEMIYPIVGVRGSGAQLVDVDGNTYVDLAMGFGVHLLGHDDPGITQALRHRIDRGVIVGPQSEDAARLAAAICRMTGVERVAFCNSGTEAVMTAIRLARAATGRDKIAIFRGSYHGHADSTLALGRTIDGCLESVPMAPGVPQSVVNDVLVLDYADPRALEAIEVHAEELAAVLVEPVQSRQPELQPRAFLHELRTLTEARGIALVFDEVITGFRLHPRGAQGRFDVEADLVTYGKLLGGGMPIGVVGGRAHYMDRIDGGPWQFGDASLPTVEPTFFAGTFAKHPLAMAAGLEVLARLEREGAALYDALEVRTRRLAEGLNAVFVRQQVDWEATYCASILRIGPRGALRRVAYLHEPLELRLFYHHLIERGVYVWEGRTVFISTAHRDEDVDTVIAAAEASILVMKAGGFFGGLQETSAPLSWWQEGLWLQSQVEHDSGSYNLPGAVRICGPLNRAALCAAVAKVVARHDILRARFVLGDGQPRQELASVEDCAVTVVHLDWTGNDGQDADGRLRRFVDAQARTPFALDRAPLLRLWTISTGPDEHFLVVVMHHLVGDSWSFGIFVEELTALYAAQLDSAMPPLSPLPLRYLDYARRQREASPPSAAYWATALEGAPTLLPLPTDEPRTQTSGFHSTTYRLRLPSALVEGFTERAKESKATLHMALLAAFGLLLGRHCDADDLLIGGPTATRERPEHRALIGLFVNTLVFRVRIDSSQTFAELLARTRSMVLDAYAHQAVPFREVVRVVEPRRSADRHPLFQVWFNLDVDGPAMRLGDLEVEALEDLVDTPTQHDLSLLVQKRSDGLFVKWIYNERLFHRATIVEMAQQLEGILQQVVEHPQRPLRDFSLLTARARASLVDPARPLALTRRPSVTATLVSWAERAPRACAIAQGSAQWSYRELLDAATQIAERLAPVPAQAVVAVRGAPSFGLIASIVGVMLGGHVVLPIDPGLPAARQALIYEESRACGMVGVGESPSEPELGPRVLVDADTARCGTWETPPVVSSRLSETEEPSDADGGPAYVFFTSGTTGTPKGVLGTHAGLSHFIEWQRSTYEIGPSDRVAQAVRLSFDAVLRDIFLPLTSGATLCLPEGDALAEPASVVGWLRRERISVLHTVPTLGQLWVGATFGEPVFPDLRHVFFAGEPLTAELVGRWRQAAPYAEMTNLYGATETTMVKCFQRISSTPRPGIQGVDATLPETQALVLSPHGRRCGIGELGEIVLRTPYRTRGYINAPQAQARHFVPNPGTGDPGDMLYRTGDRGRYRADGTLEILGRLDRQVKLRGVRFEPAEVESVLRALPGVEQAAVVVRGEGADRHAVAFIAPVPTSTSVEDALARVRDRLGDAFVPNRLHCLDAFPLLAHGKIDWKALERIDEASVPTSQSVLPQTPMQTVVAAYTRELLGVPAIGIHDDFFELGGHSLLAAQLVARLRRELSAELNLRSLFETPTVAGLCKQLDEQTTVHERVLALQLQSMAPSHDEHETFEL